MKQYFYLQLKRLLRIFPMLLMGTLVTLLCVALLVGALWKADENSADKQRFKIAITGDTSGEYVQMGMLALQTFDDTRFSMEVLELTAEEAQAQLLAGQISAYVILPEDFIERALYGDVDTVTYVTHAGGEDIVAMFKNEVTTLVTDLVIHSQKGVYAIGDLAPDDVRGSYMDNLAWAYVQLIFARSKVCTVEELGISSGLGLPEYYIGALSVFLLLFIGVAFVTVGVRRDYALQGLLQSKGRSGYQQVLCEYGAHFSVFLCLAAVLAGVIVLAGGFLGDTVQIPGFFSLVLRLIPVAAMAAALNCLIFELTGNVVSAVLWHFFLCLGQCYVSGCFYPVYTLPAVLQRFSGVLPAGLAREFVAGSFLETAQTPALLGILLYTGGFWALTVAARRCKLRADRR